MVTGCILCGSLLPVLLSRRGKLLGKYLGEWYRVGNLKYFSETVEDKKNLFDATGKNADVVCYSD